MVSSRAELMVPPQGFQITQSAARAVVDVCDANSIETVQASHVIARFSYSGWSGPLRRTSLSFGCDVPMAIPMVASKQVANMPNPITKSAVSVMAPPQDQSYERKNRRHPEPYIQPLFLASVEPQINREQKRKERPSDIGRLRNTSLCHQITPSLCHHASSRPMPDRHLMADEWNT